MAKFAQYAMVASEEALKDAGWVPSQEEDLENTVGRPYNYSYVVLTSVGCLHRIWYR